MISKYYRTTVILIYIFQNQHFLVSYLKIKKTRVVILMFLRNLGLLINIELNNVGALKD